MLRFAPFQAIRPEPSQAPRVASPPYDVVTTDEARAVAADNDHCFLHVVRPEIDLPAGTHPYDDAVYARGRENLDRLLADGALIQDEQPRLFLYRQVMGDHQQVGVVGCCHIDDYTSDIIKKHEKTRRAKEDDRTKHVLAVNANTGPVFLTYRDEPALLEQMQHDMAGKPLYHFDVEGVTHTVWAVDDPRPYVDAFQRVPAAYVADGHHRSASAARAGATRRAANPNHTGEEAYNWFLTVLFPASMLKILPYNRIVTDLNGLTPDELRARLAEVGRVSKTDAPSPERSGVFCLYFDGAWHRLELDEAMIDRRDPVASLDVSLLHDRVLGPILGIGDPREDERVDFVGGIRGTADLERRVQRGEAALAVSMYPTSIEQLLAVADAGQIMPPKSTWFEPKLRSGLFVHSLDDAPVAAGVGAR